VETNKPALIQQKQILIRYECTKLIWLREYYQHYTTEVNSIPRPPVAFETHLFCESVSKSRSKQLNFFKAQIKR
jgi:hypothetical protein